MATVAGVATVTSMMSGCGAGMLGEGITGLSTTAVALDAGQTFAFDAKVQGTPAVTWSLSGTECAGSACGMLSSTTGASVRYTAPSTVSKAQNVVLQATVTGAQVIGTTATISLNPQVSLASVALPSTVQGGSYSAQLPVTGGKAPFQWSVTSGSLPDGVSLDAATGRISGAPTAVGTFKFDVQISDTSAVQATSQATYTMAVAPATGAAPLAITTKSLPSATLGLSYSAAISATGGSMPYSCTVSAGSLPGGLSLTGCTISGRMTGVSTNAFTVQIKDAGSPAQTVSGSFKIQQAAPPLALIGTALAKGTAGVKYSSNVTVLGGVSPYVCSVTGGALPAGLGLSGCTITGVPTGAGTGSVTLQVTDTQTPAASVSGAMSWTVGAGGLSLVSNTLPNGTVGTLYTAPLAIAGGVAPYLCSMTSGALPSGVVMNGCSFTGVPTAAAAAAITVRVSDATASSVTGSLVLHVLPTALSISSTSLAPGKVGASYSSAIAVNGGQAPYACSVAGGALPAGLTLTGCSVTGTPTNSGAATVTVAATDAGSPAQRATASLSLSVSSPSLALSTTGLPTQGIGSSYATALTIAGGTAPYSCSITNGALPDGLVLSGCSVTGKAGKAGSGSATVKVVDGSSPQATVSGAVSWTVTGSTLALSSASLPTTYVGKWYTVNLPVRGGAAPYKCSVTGGHLAAGLVLQGCTVVGTPTEQGAGSFTVRVADSTAQAIDGSLGLVVKPAASTASTLALATTTLPNGTAAVFYSSTIGATGGKAPYNCSVTGGTLPAGLALSGCAVTGTPKGAANAALTVQVSDASSPAQAASGSVALAIAPAVLTLASASMPAGVAGQTYAGSMTATGGTAPYHYSVTSGTLPAGLVLGADGSISGSPSASGTANFSAQVTDAGSPQMTASHPFSITVAASALTLSSATLPTATAGQAYDASLSVNGGTAPYACGLVAGALPSGLTLSGCKVSGTPTTGATLTVTVKATDAGTPMQTASGSITLPVVGSSMAITTNSLKNATKNVAYSTPIVVTGGTGAVNCAVTGGVLPAGLQINGASCTIAGTPTASGAASLTITATDSHTPYPNTAAATLALTVNGSALSLSAAAMVNPVLGQAYNQTLSATGGQGPYSYAVSGGALPAGLTLAATGLLSGTPTAAGASSVVVTVTDSAATAETATQMYVPLVVYPAGANNGQLSGPYAFLVQGFDAAASGDLPYQAATVGSFTADGGGLVTTGEMDSNHQAGAGSVQTAHLLGTYEVGADDRGLVTLTVVNADGTTGASNTYAVAAAAQVAADGSSTAADVAVAGGAPMLNNGAPGMLLAQDKTAFAKALKGSYAFGVKGDTPCLATCGNGVTGGPVAEVGQFTANGSGVITGGVADSAIATTDYARESLSGTAGSADSNGRLDMTLNTAGTPAGVFPTSYAVYVVDANQALLMSNDSHATHILLSGTAQAQTQTSFANSAMAGAFLGAVDATADPASLAVSLSSISAAGTATVFRGTAAGDGNCALTNVDVAGGAQLTAAVQAAGNSGAGITALLGARGTTGAVSCAVTAEGRGVLTAATPSAAISGVLNNLGLAAMAGASRVFYLTAPGRGYFLETGYAALGSFEPQTGSPFSKASFSGRYDFGTGAAATSASDSGSGVMLADGSGSVTITPDAGLGANGLPSPGSNQTAAYSLSDAAAGRVTMNGVVLYAISPDRLLRLDEGTSVNAPSIGSVQR